MKKVVCFSLLLSLFFSFTACNDYKEHSYSISACDIISGEKLTIKMHVRRVLVGFPTEHFSVKMDLKELSDAIIKSASSVTTEIYQNEYIVTRTESSFFLLQERKQEKDAYQRYTFFAPVANNRYELGIIIILIYPHGHSNPRILRFPFLFIIT